MLTTITPIKETIPLNSSAPCFLWFTLYFYEFQISIFSMYFIPIKSGNPITYSFHNSRELDSSFNIHICC